MLGVRVLLSSLNSPSGTSYSCLAVECVECSLADVVSATVNYMLFGTVGTFSVITVSTVATAICACCGLRKPVCQHHSSSTALRYLLPWQLELGGKFQLHYIH